MKSGLKPIITKHGKQGLDKCSGKMQSGGPWDKPWKKKKKTRHNGRDE